MLETTGTGQTSVLQKCVLSAWPASIGFAVPWHALAMFSRFMPLAICVFPNHVSSERMPFQAFLHVSLGLSTKVIRMTEHRSDVAQMQYGWSRWPLFVSCFFAAQYLYKQMLCLFVASAS